MFKNGGHLLYKNSGTMDLLAFRVFYNPDSIANILIFLGVTSQFIFTMDTNKEPSISVHTGQNYFLKFYQCHGGLYYFDISALNVFNNSVNSYSFFTTLQETRCFS